MILNLYWRDLLNRHPQKNDLNKHANMIPIQFYTWP